MLKTEERVQLLEVMDLPLLVEWQSFKRNNLFLNLKYEVLKNNDKEYMIDISKLVVLFSCSITQISEERGQNCGVIQSLQCFRPEMSQEKFFF